MEIKVRIGKHVYSLCFGHKTPWFEQLDWFTLTEEFYYKREVVFASMIFKFGREGEDK